MASNQFLTDRERGRVGQHLLATTLRRFGVSVKEVEDGFFQDFDLELSTGVTIEVKTDYKSHKTSNIALELEALDHSKADILAISYGVPIMCFYLIPMNEARDFAHQWNYKIKAGEFDREIALVKRSLFIEKLKPEIIEV